MNTFFKIKDMASRLNKACFTKDQYIIITGIDYSDEEMFSYTSGDFFGVIALLSEYIERLEKNNTLGLTKYDFLDMLRKSFEEDDEYDTTS